MVSAKPTLAVVAFLPFALCKLGFQLYPLIPTQPMAEMLGVSENCVKALNTTLPCDDDLFRWTVKVDDVYWTEQDVSTLCVPDCQADARTWTETVASACSEDWLVVGDRAVPAETLSLRFVEGLEMACLRDTGSQWCLPASYNWTGSDVVQVDCAANPADPWCINPANVSAENSRISTLYDDDLLCSECFLNMMYRRVTSEFLPDTDHSDYLVSEFQDIQSVCQTSVGPLATRAVPLYPYASELQELNETAPEPTGTPSTGAPIVGDDGLPWDPEEDPEDPGIDEEIPDGEEDPDEAEPEPEPAEPVVPTNCTARAVDVRYASLDGIEACNELGEEYGVATGQLMYATGADDCYSYDFVCVPEACQLLRVNAGDTCETISKAISNETDPVSVAQLMTWNPNLMGACDFLAESQYICISRPGGTWVKPPDADIPENSNGPVRGGPGSTEILPIVTDPSTVPDDRKQEGIPANCNRFVKADNTAASCWKIGNDAKITQTRLWELNPALGANGENCGTQIWLGYYYCVGTPEDGTATPTTSTQSGPASTASATASSVPKPTPQHEGTDPSCNKWTQATEGAGCWQLATDAGVDLALFYKWNPVLGADGENCGTMIWPTYYYCVGVSSAATTPTTTMAPPATTTAPAKPTNTQAGIPDNCSRFAQAEAGASCWQLANDNGIDMSVLFALNPVLGPAGENCGTQIWPTYYYCIATS
ncbi:LysM domain-containing protein [Colletotrichum navitas]|uniref:LysM domain-containing protein n=1 Tax=Colletotrichum navitas TaxID=681940 RepID=A0AAD8PRZ7_9PEZI|nr:LysM domain-containing protein [Colletotrichum navitas]KAK1579648.1 LysM domain-containing protein [Colletotrichum navitas]